MNTECRPTTRSGISVPDAPPVPHEASEPLPGDESFPGSENLEIMQEAKRYNAFLAETIVRLSPPGGRLLDFGAGSGTITRLVAAAIPGGAGRITCIEPDPALRARLAESGFAIAASMEESGQGSFDFAYTLNVLEHIENDGAAIRQLRDALRPGARLFIYVPAFMSLYSAMDDRVGHLRRYRRGDLVKLCRMCGLLVEQSTYVDSLGFAASLLLRLAGPRSATLNPRAVRLYDRVVFPASRAIDRLVGSFVGKNVAIVASRPQD